MDTLTKIIKTNQGFTKCQNMGLINMVLDKRNGNNTLVSSVISFIGFLCFYQHFIIKSLNETYGLLEYLESTLDSHEFMVFY